MTNTVPSESASRSSTSGKCWVQQLLENPLSSEAILSKFQHLVDGDSLKVIKELPTQKQMEFLEIIDKAAPKSLTKDTGTEFVATLGVIFSDLLLLPTELLRGVEESHGFVTSGRIADIKREIWNNQSVALKAFRTQSPWDLQEAKKILWKLVPIWKRLLHDNVLSFHGVGMSKSRLVLVYDWGHKGNITQYLESSPNASRPELLLQIAKGLQYLHSLEIIHGNLKGTNVLISETGKAQICDYGLSPITSNPVFMIAEASGGFSRCLAPEIIDPSNKARSKPLTASKPADVFAFAMLAVEVFSGKPPFGDMKKKSVASQITDGKRPDKPQAAEQLGLTAEMWKLIRQCWNANPNKRPTIDDVVTTWEGFVNRSNPHPPVSRAPTHRSQSTDPSTMSPGEPATPPPRKRCLCGLL